MAAGGELGRIHLDFDSADRVFRDGFIFRDVLDQLKDGHIGGCRLDFPFFLIDLLKGQHESHHAEEDCRQK